MSLLDDVLIAAPCNMSWDQMAGNDRVRHCGGCQKNVYNISAMSNSDAEKFLRANSSSQCLRIFRRADGTIITDNCPVGLRKLRDRARHVLKFVAALVSNVIAITAAYAQQSTSGTPQPPSKDFRAPGFSSLGIPAMRRPVVDLKRPKRGTTYLTDECSGLNAQDSNFTPQPKMMMGKMAIRRTPAGSNQSLNGAADGRAIMLFGEAQIAEQKGDQFLAFALYQDAIRASRSNPRSDPQFIRMLESSYSSLRSRIQNPVLVDPYTGEQLPTN